MALLSELADRLRLNYRTARRKPSPDATADKLERLLQACPLCGQSLYGHSYARLVTTIAGDGTDESEARLRVFFEALKERRWKDALAHESFDSTRDAVDIFVLRCGSGGVALLYASNPYALDLGGELLDGPDVLDERGTRTLESLIRQADWKTLRAFP